MKNRLAFAVNIWGLLFGLYASAMIFQAARSLDLTGQALLNLSLGFAAYSAANAVGIAKRKWDE